MGLFMEREKSECGNNAKNDEWRKRTGQQSEMPSCMPSQGEGAEGCDNVWLGAGLCHAESGSHKVSAVCVAELLW